MSKGEPDFGYFEEPDKDDETGDEGIEISDDEMEAMLEADDHREHELRLTHVALRHQLLDRATAFVSVSPKWKAKTLKQRLFELQVTYRMMSKLTEDE